MSTSQPLLHSASQIFTHSHIQSATLSERSGELGLVERSVSILIHALEGRLDRAPLGHPVMVHLTDVLTIINGILDCTILCKGRA